MAWSTWTDKVTAVDTVAAADVNQLAANILAVKGGAAGTAPTKALETLISEVSDMGGVYSADTSTSQTLVYTSGNVTYNPTASHDVNLPTTSVVSGWTRRIFNRSAAYVLTVKASGGATVVAIQPKTWVEFQARQATPTTNAHWSQVDAGGSWYAGGTVAGDFSAGWGTCSDIVSNCRRSGPELEWRLKFLSGTAAGNVCTITIPNSLSIGTNFLHALNRLGEGVRFTGSGGAAGLQIQAAFYDSSSGATVVKIVYRVSGDANKTWNADVGTDMFGNAENHSYWFRIPISGWALG